MTQLLPPKKEVALALLERSNVDVYLDPRAKGVVVPPQFRKEPRLILKIGLNMPVPIPDLRLDDESMSCTLSFNRAKFFCVVPWLSVFAMVGDDGRGMVWPDDVPQELAVRVVDDRRPSAPGTGAAGPTGLPATAAGSAAAGAGPVGPVGLPSVPREAGDAPVPNSSRGGKGKSRIQPDAPRDSDRGDAAAASERGGARRSRSKKKKDEAPARPVLVAVPTPEKSSPRIEKLDERRDAALERERPERAERNPPATPRISGGGAGRPAAPVRPKRELPPYLRVVK